MGKQQEKKTANATDKLFVFGLDEDGKPRGARFPEFNEKVVSAAEPNEVGVRASGLAGSHRDRNEAARGKAVRERQGICATDPAGSPGQAQGGDRGARRRKPRSPTRASAIRRKDEGGALLLLACRERGRASMSANWYSLRTMTPDLAIGLAWC